MKWVITFLSFYALSSDKGASAQQNNPSTDEIPWFGDGTAGVATDNLYYDISAAMAQNETDHICFVDTVLPPDFAAQLTAQMCPSGKMSLDDCKTQCAAMGTPSLVACPINRAGCCECPFFSFQNNNADAGTRYDFDAENPYWGAIPGWFNLAVWSLLSLALAFLLVTVKSSYHKTRNQVILVSRTMGLVGIIMFAIWIFVYLIGMNAIAYQAYYAFSSTAIGIFLHVFCGGIWAISGVLQFVGPIRRRWPRVHRISGWVCVVTTILSTIGLFILILSPHGSSLGGTVLSFIFAAYWNVTLGLGVYFIIKREIDSHRRWMTRHMFVGASIVLQRTFNVLTPYIFKDLEFFTGAFFPAACGSPSDISSVTIASTDPFGEASEVLLNADQMVFACNGIGLLAEAYIFTFQLAVVFAVCGIFGCELWLWACGLQASQQSVALAGAVIDLPSCSTPGTKITIRRQVENEIVVTLAEKEIIAEDAFRIRFRFADDKEALLVPLLGHVNLRKEGMLRPRPYSPVHALEPGFITFFVRRQEGGLLSTYMTQDMKVGDTLLLSGPSAPLEAGPVFSKAKNILIIAGGTGIAPFLSMLEMIPETTQCCVLVREKSKERAIGLKGRDLGRENVHVEYLFSRQKFQAHLDSVLAAEAQESNAESKMDAILICGPNAFNVAVKSSVERRLGVPCFAVGTDDR